VPTSASSIRKIVLVAAFGTLLAAPAVMAKQLVIYNASDSVNSAVVEAFKAEHPDIDVQVVSGSTGPIAERAIAEKANPQADIVYLVNEDALDQLKQAGVFEPYQPKDSKVPSQYLDPDGFYAKLFVTTMCMVVNTDRLKEKHLPAPTTWEDLIKPIYKNEIALPSPIKSGTGGVILTTMVDAFGWPYVENLADNVYQWSDGGSGGATLAGNGEVAIGLSYDTTCFKTKTSGKPVDVVFGRITPGDTEGGGIVAGSPNPEEAKTFMDFLVSDKAADALGKVVGATAAPGHGLVNLTDLSIWKLRRPVNVNEFRTEFTKRILKQ
jgi:iron(III) transport system substrate-binding protein